MPVSQRSLPGYRRLRLIAPMIGREPLEEHRAATPLELFVFDPAGGACERLVLGPLADGGRPQHVVTAGRWQAARSLGVYTLGGCCVGPGFDFADFELAADLPAQAALLRAQLPDLAGLL